MAVPVLVSLANHTHQQATKAVADAQAKLCEPLDLKMDELKDFRAQTASQEKRLQQLIASCNLQVSKLNKNRASDSQISKARGLQTEIEKLNQQIRVIEKAEELKTEHSSRS